MYIQDNFWINNDDYIKMIANKNNRSGAIYICFCRLFRLKFVNRVKLTFYTVIDRRNESSGMHLPVLFVQISFSLSGRGCEPRGLLLATVMGAHHHVAVGGEVRSGRPHFVPAGVGSVGRTCPTAGVVFLQVGREGFPASAHAHHHLPLV